MKGKHGKAAAVRHEVADLEARALKAEQQLAKVTAEYEGYRVRAEAEAADLRNSIQGLKRGGDALLLASDIRKALDDLAARTAERDEARAGRDSAERKLKKAHHQFVRLFATAQDAFGHSEALDLLERAGLAHRGPDGKVVWMTWMKEAGASISLQAIPRGWQRPA